MSSTNKPALALLIALSLGFGAALPGCSGKKSSAEYLAAAKESHGKGRNDVAVIELKNLLAAEPNHDEGRLLFAKILNEQGDGGGAERELRKVSKPGQGAPAYRIELARSLQLQDKGKELLADIRPDGLPMEPAAELLAIRGSTHLALRQLPEARTAFDEALKINPKSIEAILGLASLAVVSKDLPAAEAQVDRALAVAPSHAEALLFKGDILRQTNKEDAAREVYLRAAAAAPRNFAPPLRLASLAIGQNRDADARKHLAQVDKIRSGVSDSRYYSALIDFRAGQYDKAQAGVQEVLKTAPKNVAANLLAGAIAERKGLYSLAESHLAPVVAAFPGNSYARRLLINSLLKSSQQERALEVLQRGLQQDGDDPAMLALAGDVYYQNRQFALATQYLDRASKLSPDNYVVRTRLGMSRMAGGDTERAMAELEAVSKEDVDGGQADYVLVMTHLNRLQYDRALAAWAALEKKQPQNPYIHTLKGSILLGKQDRAGARLAMEKALALQPSFLPALLGLGRLDLQDKQPDQTRKRFELALAKEPKNAQLMVVYAGFLQQLPGQQKLAIDWLEKARRAQPTAIQPILMLADNAVRAGEINKALAYAQEAVASQPDNRDALYLLARLQLANGQKNQAVTSYRKLTALDAESPVAHFRLAGVLAGMNDERAAIESLKQALKLKPDYVEAIVTLGGMLGRSGDLNSVLALAQAAQQHKASAFHGHLLEGDVRAQQKAYSEALGAYRKAAALQRDANVIMKQYAVLKQSGDKAAGDRLLQQWFREQPKDTRVRNYLAEEGLRSGNLRQAVEHYQLLLKQAPKNAVALNNLAWAYQQLKDPRARATAEAAYALNPNGAMFADTLAMILLEQGEHGRSLELLRKASRLQPDDTEIAAHLALAMLKSGNRKEAQAIVDRLRKAKAPILSQPAAAPLLAEFGR